MILGGGFFDSKWVVGVLLYNSISYSVVFKFFRMLAKNKTRENWMNGGGHAKWLFEKIKKDIQIEQNWKFLKLLYTYRHRKHTLTFLKPPAELLENNLYLICLMCVCTHAQSCLTLCDPLDCFPQGFSVHGIFQARMQVAISYSMGIFPTQGSNLISCISCIGGQILYHCFTWEAKYA